MTYYATVSIWFLKIKWLQDGLILFYWWKKKKKKKDDGITSGEYFSNPPFTLIVTAYRDYDKINMSCRPPKR